MMDGIIFLFIDLFIFNKTEGEGEDVMIEAQRY